MDIDIAHDISNATYPISSRLVMVSKAVEMATAPSSPMELRLRLQTHAT